MSLQRFDELTQVIVAADAMKALLGKEQCGGSPPQHHLGSAPAFNPTRPSLGPRKAAFNQVGRAERPHQKFV